MSTRRRNQAPRNTYPYATRTARRELGRCRICGVDAGTNPRTGRPFWACRDHRMENSAQLQRRRRSGRSGI